MTRGAASQLGLVPAPRVVDLAGGVIAHGWSVSERVEAGRTEEEYVLEVRDDGVRLTGGSARAVGWARQTLRQLETPTGGLPLVRIEDAPRFPWRGVMLDVARHFMPFDWLLGFVELVAAEKHNVLHLHLTDDEGWRLEVRSHTELVAVGSRRPDTAFPGQVPTGTAHEGCYSQEQLRTLVAHAAALGVTVVPEVDFPGHAGAFLRAHPELAVDPARFVDPPWRVHGQAVRPSERAWRVVTDVYDELLDIFPGPVHIGGDEVEGLTSTERASFSRRLVRHVLERGREALAWDEVLDDDPATHATVVAWRSELSGIRAAESGHHVVMAPASATYLDRPQAPGERDVPGWGHLLTWQQVRDFDPTRGMSAAAAARVRGTQAQLWTEYLPTPEDVEHAAWPRLSAHAEVAWSGRAGTGDFPHRLAVHAKRLRDRGVRIRPLE